MSVQVLYRGHDELCTQHTQRLWVRCKVCGKVYEKSALRDEEEEDAEEEEEDD